MSDFLAFDTATEHLSIALQVGARVWSHEGAGGAQASTTLIPSIMGLLGQAGVGLRDLDAIAFGRGPGAFTGLRAACAVAQGLAFGAGLPVLAIDSLLAVAEDARIGAQPQQVWVVMDARMGEVYAALYAFADGAWRTRTEPMLATPEALAARWQAEPPEVVAGSALIAFPAMIIPAFKKVRESSLERAILNNLRQISAAADMHFLENGVAHVSIAELVGPKKFIKALISVAGESYYDLTIHQGKPISVTTKEGKVVTYNP